MPNVRVDQWPHDAMEVKNNKKGEPVTVFRPMALTIARVIAGTSAKGNPYAAWVFEGDTTPVTGNDGKQYKGATWWASGEWDEGLQAYSPYSGPKFGKGQRVNVALAMREDATGKQNYEVRKIEAVNPEQASEQPDDADYDDYVAKKLKAEKIAADFVVKPEWDLSAKWRERQNVIQHESIERQTVLKSDGTLLAALYALPTMDKELTNFASEVAIRYTRLADQLANLAAVPQAEVYTDADMEGEDVKK